MKAGCNAFKPSLVSNPGWFASIYSDETPEVGLQRRPGRPARTLSPGPRPLACGAGAVPAQVDAAPASRHAAVPRRWASVSDRTRYASSPQSGRCRGDAQHPQGVRRDDRGQRRVVRDRRPATSSAARRERGRQVDAGEAAVGPDPADDRQPVRCSASRPCSTRRAPPMRTASRPPSRNSPWSSDLTVLDNMLMPYPPAECARADPPARGAAAGRRPSRRARPRRHRSPGRSCATSTSTSARRSRSPGPCSASPQILLLDEPTSTLSGRDIDWLGDLIARLQGRGRHDRLHLAPHARGAGLLRPRDRAAQRQAHRDRATAPTSATRT